MRVLLINPNTTPDMTERVLNAARVIVQRDTELVGATGRFGARYISTRAAAAVAAHAALDAYAEHGAGCDAVLLACFGDPGLAGLKEIASVPVVGMAEASCLTAVTLGARFAIVTGGERWGPMLTESVAGLGLSSRLAGVRTVAPTGAAIAADPGRALGLLAEACRDCVTVLGAEVVILGGAGLAGLASHIAADVPVPLIDSVTAGVLMAENLGRLGVARARTGSHAPTDAVETVGLSEALAKRMGGGQ